MNIEQQTYNRSKKWVQVYNGTGSDIPPNALVEVVGANADSFIALKPRTDSCFCYVTGHNTIRNGEYGIATADVGNLIISTKTLAASETVWGAKAGSFIAEADQTGFKTIKAGSADATQGTVFRAYADRQPSGENGFWIRVTGDTADANGNYPAVILKSDGVGGRSDGIAVFFKLIGGNSVVNSGHYWATRNGSATLSGNTRPLLDGNGNDRSAVPYCEEVDGVDTEGYRYWRVPHPWQVESFVAGALP